MRRKGPIKIEWWCDGCDQIKLYQGGSIGCKETGKSLYGFSKVHSKGYLPQVTTIPTPDSCPYLLKKRRKEKLENLDEKDINRTIM